MEFGSDVVAAGSVLVQSLNLGSRQGEPARGDGGETDAAVWHSASYANYMPAGS